MRKWICFENEVIIKMNGIRNEMKWKENIYNRELGIEYEW